MLMRSIWGLYKDSNEVISVMQKKEIESLVDEELTNIFPKRSIERVLFVAPPDVDKNLFNYSAAKRGRCWNMPPYGAGVIASHLRNDGLSVGILNLNNEI